MSTEHSKEMRTKEKLMLYILGIWLNVYNERTVIQKCLNQVVGHLRAC